MAQKILARLSEEAKSRYVHAYNFALMYLALGDKERAIDEMGRAYRERAGNDIALIKVEERAKPLRMLVVDRDWQLLFDSACHLSKVAGM